ncbi:MAG: hypothetical protein HQ522_21160, partial [Bacteroidetes bacterium]|nr:hypothetical protein [Bacteroidota bacterium]
LKQTSLAAAGIAVTPSIVFSQNPGKKDISQILKNLSELNDVVIEELLLKQIDKSGDRWDGGVFDRYELPNAHATNDFIMKLGAAYASPYSKYHLSEKLENPLERAIQCLLNVQHNDGTIDLHSTNFHSTPDTAFLVNYLSPGYVNLKRLNHPGLKTFVEKTEEFFQNAGKCFVEGGVHTANHRWVVSSAMARLNSFFPSKKYLVRIDDWLAEGIDLDPDGQYTERSVSVYSPTCDDMFLTMGRLLKREDLMDVVRKNLDMTLYYIQPGGEVLTDASGRQDSAYTGYVNYYYYTYLYFAITDKNPVYSAVCKLIEQEMPEKILKFLPYILELPLFEQEPPQPAKIPNNYFKRFQYSGLFRIRRGDTDISIIENNPTFLSFMKGSAVMQSMRLGASFFGSRGQFVAEQTNFDGKKIELMRSHKHGYFQPFPKDKITGDGIYSKMPREERELSEAQIINYKVSIIESSGKVSIEIDIHGTDYVPVSLEMSFRPGGELTGVTADKNAEDTYFLESGMGQYKKGDDVITFGPGTVSHKWAEMRGMLPKQKGNSVYITGYTPFKHTIELS